MKKIGFILIAILSVSVLYAQEEADNFSILLENNKKDKELVKKLEDYKEGGIEKELDLKDVTIDQLIETAEGYLGTPHCMGGTTKECIDCSGLLYATFRDLGINVPRDSQDFSRYGKIIIDVEELQRGDLVFFVKTYNTSKVITHSGIYLGDYKFIHTSTKNGVSISNVNGKYYWGEHFIFGTRIF